MNKHRNSGRLGKGNGTAPPSPSAASSSIYYNSPEATRRELHTPVSTPGGSEWLGDLARLKLGVSGSEQVYIDPQNRDAVISPRRGEDKGQYSMCTAFIVDVSRGDGLQYSIPVRFSRFERLHAEYARARTSRSHPTLHPWANALAPTLPPLFSLPALFLRLVAELPSLQPLLPSLPAKRGPLDPAKLGKLFASLRLPSTGAPAGATSSAAPLADDPSAIEARTRALDAYLRSIVQLPGVSSSSALLDLVALSAAAEAAVRQALGAAASHDEARVTALDDLSRELATSSAYVRTARAARERSEARALALSHSLNATAGLLSRRREAASVARAWRSWQALCRAATAQRHAKYLRSANQAGEAQRERAELLATEVLMLKSQLAEANAAMQEEQTLARRLEAESESRRLAALATEEAARVAALAASAEVEAAVGRANAAANAAAAARAEARALAQDVAAQRATAAALAAALASVDEELALTVRCVQMQEKGAAAMRAHLKMQRKWRVALALRCALEQRASEAQFLFLIESQRESLNRSALELAAVRRAAAVERNDPELEAPWLKPPPLPTPTLVEAAAAAAAEAEAEAWRETVEEKWRREWLAGMSHTL